VVGSNLLYLFPSAKRISLTSSGVLAPRSAKVLTPAAQRISLIFGPIPSTLVRFSPFASAAGFAAGFAFGFAAFTSALASGAAASSTTFAAGFLTTGAFLAGLALTSLVTTVSKGRIFTKVLFFLPTLKSIPSRDKI